MCSANGPHTITVAQVGKLESVAFEWDERAASWLRHFNELRAVYETDVPVSARRLQKWVSAQRAGYDKEMRRSEGWQALQSVLYGGTGGID